MENPELSDSSEEILYFYPGDFSEENDLYDENEDVYDIHDDDSYDDGIEKSSPDDDWDAVFEEEPEITNQETCLSAFEQELKDSLSETEDYDKLDD
jgi:hypothetical protein